MSEPERPRRLKDVSAYIDELVGQGGYSPDVIWDGDWITLTRRRLERLLEQVRLDAKAEHDVPRDGDKQSPEQEDEQPNDKPRLSREEMEECIAAGKKSARELHKLLKNTPIQ
jgi:hypothetical protein